MTRLLIGISIAFFVSPLNGAVAAAEVALVYNGRGACKEHCAQAAAQIAVRSHLKIRYVDQHFDDSVFNDAVVWIQPGGDAIEVAHALSAQRMEMIRTFIRNGGSYLGFCAGMFLSDTWVDDYNTIPGLGIIPGSTQDYVVPHNPVMLPIDWKGHVRQIYFEEGGYFLLGPNAPATPIAWYPDGKVAAIHTTYGQGRVAVSGPHPEALAEWKSSESLTDSDGSDFYLAIEMIQWLLRL